MTVTDYLQNPTLFLITVLSVMAIIGAIIISLVGLGYVGILWIRNRKRESTSLNSTLLQITVPRDNDIKIDAAEQLFSSLASIRRVWSSDKWAYFKAQPHLSFE